MLYRLGIVRWWRMFMTFAAEIAKMLIIYVVYWEEMLYLLERLNSPKMTLDWKSTLHLLRDPIET